MAKVKFDYYLHDDYNSYERGDYILGQLEDQGVFPEGELDIDEFSQKLSGSFYEVKLVCELDTETFEVDILEVQT